MEGREIGYINNRGSWKGSRDYTCATFTLIWNGECISYGSLEK